MLRKYFISTANAWALGYCDKPGRIYNVRLNISGWKAVWSGIVHRIHVRSGGRDAAGYKRRYILRETLWQAANRIFDLTGIVFLRVYLISVLGLFRRSDCAVVRCQKPHSPVKLGLVAIESQ